MSQAAAAITAHRRRGLYAIGGSDLSNGGLAVAAPRLVRMFGVNLNDAQNLLIAYAH